MDSNLKEIQQFEHKNIEELYGHIAQTLNKDDIENYKDSCRKFVYMDSIFSSAKSKQFFENALKEVHPGIKYSNSKKAKNILRSMCKVFLQELAQKCIEVMNLTNKQAIDLEVVNQANRRICAERQKLQNMSNAFK